MKKTILLALILAFAGFAVWAQAPAGKAAPAAKPAAKADAPSEPAPPTPPELSGKTRFQGNIINTGGSVFLGGIFFLEIQNWTTLDEAKQWKDILVNQGQDALLKKVWDAKQIGYLKLSTTMGKPIFLARAIPVPGGYVIRCLTNTPISNVGMRSEDYPFGFLEMFVPTTGKTGHGSIVGMAKIGFDAQGTLQVAAYGNLPIELAAVGFEKEKK